MRIIIRLSLCFLLSACATRERPNPAYFSLAPGNLPPTDVTLHIPGLTSCTDNPDHGLHLKLGQPVYVLVHGCFGSSGQFRGLAQVLAFHGQQTVCFDYDGRARLTSMATTLRRAIDLLSTQARAARITVIGHSQGALIARKSLTDRIAAPPSNGTDLRLVTISGPFSGIDAAKPCGRTWLYPLSLGLLQLSCYAVTGPKWKDITGFSDFIREPGALVPQVSQYLKIDTDERAACRREEGGQCVEHVVFSLSEQRNAIVETDHRVRRVEVIAGHVEIVGDKRVAPTKLIEILQEQGAIPPTAPARLADFQQLLEHIYRRDESATRFP